MDLMTDLRTLFQDHQLYHSNLQIDYFIIGKSGGTTYGQYRQALRELTGRFRGLKSLYSSKVKLEIDLERTQEKINHRRKQEFQTEYEEKMNSFRLKELEIKYTEQLLGMEDLKMNIRDTEREFKRFYGIAVSLKRKIGELTPEKRDKLDEEFWFFNKKCAIALDFMGTGRIQKGTIEDIHSCPKKIKDQLIECLKNPKQTVAWYEEYHLPIPEFEELPDSDLPKLLETFDENGINKLPE